MTDQANRFLHLAAPQIGALTPYVPGKPVSELERELGIRDAIKLASNENPLGCGEAARSAYLAEAADLGRYPDGGGFALRRAIAAHHGVEPAQVTLGNGSNDVLDLIARVFLHPGKESVFSEHAFAVYPIVTTAVGATPRVAPAKDYGHDLDAMADLVNERTGVVWIANPNNPTGTWLAAKPLRAFVSALPPHCICVIDEAYFEYVEEPDYPDASRWLDTFPNLIVTRTFAKVHGLAALRVGYGLSHAHAAELKNRLRHPFNVNAPAQAAATAALGDRAHVARSVALNRREMVQLQDALQALGLGYIPSVGNFLTVDVGRPAGAVNQALLRQGVICRPVASYGLPNHLRISVGLPAENDRLLKALAQVLEQAESPMIERLAIIGVGLIGGSLARALRAAGAVGEVIGCGRSRANLELAFELGVIDTWTQTAAEAVRRADIVFLSVPLGGMRPILEEIKDALPPRAILTDAGSVKGSVIADARHIFGEVPPCFVPGHPIAGTERSGVASSFPELYQKRRVILTPLASTDPEAVAHVREMWETVGAEVTEMTAEHHDEVLAATSHLPHMLAFGLVDALARMRSNDEIFRYAAGGFRDFTRIASSNPEMWRDICIANADALSTMLARFGDEMRDLAETIGRGDGDYLFEIFSRARAARDRHVDEGPGEARSGSAV